MNRFIRCLKKNIPFGPAFLLAILIHFLIFTISGSISDNSQNEIKTLIALQMKPGSNKASGYGGPAAKSGQRIKTKQSTSKSITALSEQNASTAGISPESGNGAGKDSGKGIGFGFEESIVNFKEPQYPIMALKRGIEGNVKVRIKISEDGVPVEIIILTSSNNQILDNAALKVIPEWRFQKRPGGSYYFVEKTFVFKIKG